MELPTFTSDGVLPAGTYRLTLDELRSSHLVSGHGSNIREWDEPWRRHLVDNLALIVPDLWRVGVEAIFIDGSFVEAKPRPNDIDGYFECELEALYSGTLLRQLNAGREDPIWGWSKDSRVWDPETAKSQLRMWSQYRIELFPHISGFPSGIRNQFGYELEFPAAFRLSRLGFREKGIVQIVRCAHS